MFLGMPIVPWGARLASLNVPSQKTILSIRTREIRYLILASIMASATEGPSA
jgi:hypothetical protein